MVLICIVVNLVSLIIVYNIRIRNNIVLSSVHFIIIIGYYSKVAQNDAHAIAIARNIVRNLNLKKNIKVNEQNICILELNLCF